MTHKEMTELFSVMLLAWPNAEAFKGGIAKLGPTIKLWTGCTAEVDFWTGQQAVIRLCKTNKFPPTIAEFRSQVDAVNSKIKKLTDSAFLALRNAKLLSRSLKDYYKGLPDSSLSKKAIDLMGGVDTLTLSYEHNGKVYCQWNLSGFEQACATVIRGMPTLVGGKPSVLPNTKKQEAT